MGFVLRFRGELDVAKDEVCVLENLLGTGKVAGAGGIERGVDAVGAERMQQLVGKVRLKQRLAAGERDAPATAEKCAVRQNLLHDLVHARLRAALGVPAVRIMAEAAAQGTALEKHDEADARPVHGTEALIRMDASCHSGLSPFGGLIRW